MASARQVRRYLAHWFQLGKGLRQQGTNDIRLPATVYAGDRYSAEFEALWQAVLATEAACYLDGTDWSLSDLLAPAWEIADCARCEMPVPVKVLGMQSPSCPCADLAFWPDFDCPPPHAPADTQRHLGSVRDRLVRASAP